MPAETRILLTSKDLTHRLIMISDGSLSEGISGASPDQRQLSFIFEEKLSALGAVYHADREDETIYLDDDYDRLKYFSAMGVKTVWFNPGGAFVTDTMPHHDVEIRDLKALFNLPFRRRKPNLGQCLAWLDEWEVPDNVRAHSYVVAWSAYVLAVMMQNRGVSVDPILAHRGGLMHDIDKIPTLKMSGAHGRMGAEFLDEQGYPEMADILRDHIMSSILAQGIGDRGWENKLVFFCDKLVEGDRLVPFDQRLAALRRRYPEYMAAMQRAEKPIWDLSDEICEILGISSHEGLIEMLKGVL